MEEAITRDLITAIILIVVALALFVVLLSVLFTSRKNKLLKEKQLMKTQFEQELLQTQLEIQEQTLRTISEEIHDNVGQVLSLAKLNLNTFENNPQKKLDDTKELISKAINDLRDLSRSMHGDRIAELGLLQSLVVELQILQNSGEFETHFNITGDTYKLPPQKEMVIFRIVQEALNNTIKHAKAKNIYLNIKYQPNTFTLTVKDDGAGFDIVAMQNKNGIGLKNMQNRAKLIGATCTLQSSVNDGTSIVIELPIINLLNNSHA
ncbi:MAG: sensor histidine kinase [Ferruginibacter sp.]|nr:sensor histidine kinase [Bacteroidota bacterium]MBX2918331.1 sensor histidine kinase [Ferruginibacter sp.]MCB0709036.1 sensor histidine kinase [Chitinophagaceae bacterium]